MEVYSYDSFKQHLEESGPDTRRLVLWAHLRREWEEPVCHYCPDTLYKGACGWAYILCKDCGVAYCADYFNRW